MIAQDHDEKIHRPLSVAQNIRLFRCRVEFHLEPKGRPPTGTTAYRPRAASFVASASGIAALTVVRAL